MARLIYTDSSNQERSVYLGPDQPVVRIGRAAECEIRTSRQSVSRNHAEFRYVDGTFEVADLGSSNGTWLIEDDQRFEISHERLEDGDEIWCGDFIIHFSLKDLPGEAPGGPAHFGRASGQYVSGPTEAAAAFPGAQAFGAAAYHPTPARVDSGAQGYQFEDYDELGAEDLVESSFGADSQVPGMGAQMHPGAQMHSSAQVHPGAQVHSSAQVHPGEVERLRQEKQSLEELASRQTFELTDLQAQLDEAMEQLANQAELQRAADAARAQLEALRHENAQLKQQIGSGAPASEDLEAAHAALGQAQAALTRSQQELTEAHADLANLRASHAQQEGAHHELQAENARLQDDLTQRTTRLAQLEAALSEARSQLQDARLTPGADSETLRADLERSARLLTEYERRNADLRIEFDAQRQANATLRQSARDLQDQLADARQQLDDSRQRLGDAEQAARELPAAQSALADAQEQVDMLQAEVQGLKQRVQLERRRAKSGDTDELATQLEQARARLAELEEELRARPQSAQPAGLGADLTHSLRERLERLERLTDAIVRTDLEPLSTVDRIRLQAAIRETDPRQTLSDALNLLSAPQD